MDFPKLHNLETVAIYTLLVLVRTTNKMTVYKNAEAINAYLSFPIKGAFSRFGKLTKLKSVVSDSQIFVLFMIFVRK